MQELVADVRAADAETSVAQLSGWVECMTRAVGASVDEAADDAAETDKLAQLFVDDASRELQGASPAHTEASLIRCAPSDAVHPVTLPAASVRWATRSPVQDTPRTRSCTSFWFNRLLPT